MPNKKPIEDNLPGFASRMPDLKPGKYKDGTPLHEVQFLECKIILKPDLLTSTKSFLDYAKIVKRTARENDVECTDEGMAPRPQIREVVFFDTADFGLYNNAFILRQRIRYEDGFPSAIRRSSSSSGTRTCRRRRRWTCGRRSPASTT